VARQRVVPDWMKRGFATSTCEPPNMRLELAPPVVVELHCENHTVAAQLSRTPLGSAMSYVLSVVGLLLAVACTLRGPTLNPQALGCYIVTSFGWSRQAAQVTGFHALPRTVTLDSAFVQEGARRIFVPAEWQSEGSATWDNTFATWLRIEDSIVTIPSRSAFHDLGGDSIVVRWRGWGGGLTAFLEPTTFGYRGLAQLDPRQLARGAPRVTVELHRSTCSSKPA
jgi:hypothetical protein